MDVGLFILVVRSISRLSMRRVKSSEWELCARYICVHDSIIIGAGEKYIRKSFCLFFVTDHTQVSCVWASGSYKVF